MREHRIYYGFLESVHYFVEIRRNLFDEWKAHQIRNITHRDIVKWRLQERSRKAKVMLMDYRYFKQGCGNTVKLLFTVKRVDDKKENEYQDLKFKRYHKGGF